MLTTQPIPGAPTWIDLGSTDLEGAITFYRGVFGWDVMSLGPEAGGYGFFQLDGKTVAGFGPLTEEGARPAWTVYFHTTDADATTKAVEQAGGTVRFPPMDVFTAGRMAGYTDPEGAEFAVWQPIDMGGLEVATVPGSLAWTELWVPNPDAVRPFYSTVFQWKIEDMPFGDMTYVVLSPAEGEDASFGGLMPSQPGDRPAWMPYFEVADCDGAVAKAQELGGSVLMPGTDIEGVGRIAVLSDPYGARFAVIASVAG